MSIIIVSIIGVVISIVLGTIWYSPQTPFGKIHMKYIGFDLLTKEEQKNKIEEMKPIMWKTYVLQMILSLFTSFFIAFTLQMTIANGGQKNAIYFYVVSIWFAFIIPLIGSNILWGVCPPSIRLKKFFSDILYYLLQYILIAFIATIILK